jgi:rRNA-processing protein FCF1
MSKNADLFGEARFRFPGCKMLVPGPVIDELRRIGSSKKKVGGDANAAIHAISILASEGKISVEGASISGSGADPWILAEAGKSRCYVITNDSELKKKLEKIGVKSFRMAMDGRIR